jgi:hypothetical protein
MENDKSKTTRTKVAVWRSQPSAGRGQDRQGFPETTGKKEFEPSRRPSIAAASGMTEALIYKYFGSKRDLLLFPHA